MSNNRSNETIAAEAITQYWLDEEKRDDTDPFIAKSSEQHDKEMGAAVIEALTAAGRLAGAARVTPTQAQLESAILGRTATAGARAVVALITAEGSE